MMCVFTVKDSEGGCPKWIATDDIGKDNLSTIWTQPGVSAVAGTLYNNQI